MNDRRFRFPLLPALLAAALAAVPAAAAEDPPETPPVDRAVEDLRQMLERLDGLLGSMPRYALPEVTEDGDIIIRRRDPPPPDRPAAEGPGGVIDL